MTLTSLARLCAQPDLFETLVVRLTTKLDLLCFSSPLSSEDPAGIVAEGEEEDLEPAAAYAHALLATLGNVLQKKVDHGDVHVQKYVDRLLPRLFNLFVCSALAAGQEGEGKRKGLLVSDTRIVSAAGRISNLVVQTLSVQCVFIFHLSWAEEWD